MAKTKRMLGEQIKLVDIVIELLDARVPHSSQNPDIKDITGGKKRIIALNKSDLAAQGVTERWLEFFASNGETAISMDSSNNKNASDLIKAINRMAEEKREKRRLRGQIATTVRAMVIGIPNVGKSTLINKLSGRAGANASDRPGVTRGRQWIGTKFGVELLDTPGVLWPKFGDAAVGIKLAATGAISDDVFDKVNLCEELLKLLNGIDPDSYTERYKLQDSAKNANPRELLGLIGEARGFLLKGGTIDIERSAIIVLDEFRAGKLGRVSLEEPRPFGGSEPQARRAPPRN